MKIVTVLPLKKGIFRGDLTYFTGQEVVPGDVVSVPIRNKETLSLVTSVNEAKEAKSGIKEAAYNLRKIIKNKGKSIFLNEFLEAAFATSKYFAQERSGIVTTLIPNIFLEKYEKISNIESGTALDSQEERNLRSEKLLFQHGTNERISVYKTLVRESFARGKSVFLVLPTQFDIDNFSEQLGKGIAQFSFSIHSGMSDKKIMAAYGKILSSRHPVLIIGTAPFLCIPRRDIGTIVLEHESSNAYRTIKRPHFDLRIFIEIYASKIKARLVIADQLLRIETIARKETENLAHLFPLSYRIDFGGTIEIVDKKTEEKKFQVFQKEGLEEMKNALQNKKSVFIFSLRKGLAVITICRDCGETVSCEKCGSPLVLYTSHKGKRRMFVCNRCEREISGDVLCSYCGGWNLMPLGIGTDTVVEEIKRYFANEKISSTQKIKILQLDKETTKSQTGAKKTAKEFEESKGAILVGTEMAFFYLKNKVPLSMIASFDSLWSIPSFRMSERVAHIVLSILNKTSQKLIIQTKNKSDDAILAIEEKNLLAFIRNEVETRRKMNYPPFVRFVKITHLGSKEEVSKGKKILEEIFEEYSPEIFSGFISRLKGKYVTNALIRLAPEKWSLPELRSGSSMDENLYKKLLFLPPAFEIEVDPEDLL